MKSSMREEEEKVKSENTERTVAENEGTEVATSGKKT